MLTDAPRRTPVDAARADTHERRSSSLRRIPSLDGLRAVSILLVVALHTLQRYSLHHAVALPWRAAFNGSLGVTIFFVISGYLITSLLLKEHSARGTVSLRGFFLKRAFRILPPIFAYIGVLLVLVAVGRLSLTRLDVAAALLFFHNYLPFTKDWALEHFWSLSVEEQFYLLWPFVLLLCLRRRDRHGRRVAVRVALTLIAISPVLRVASFLSSNPYLHNTAGFHMHADALMFGCVAALLEGTRRFERMVRAVTRLAWVPLALLAVSSYLEVSLQNRWNAPVGETLTAFLIMLLMLWCVRNAESWVGRLLNASPVVHLGVLSYSIYLWQTLFLHSYNPQVFRGAVWAGLPPASWLGIVLVAEISYHGVEQPSLRLRNALLRRVDLYRLPAIGQRARLKPVISAKMVD